MAAPGRASVPMGEDIAVIWDDSLLDELRRIGDSDIDALVRDRLGTSPTEPAGPEQLRVAVMEFLTSFRARDQRSALASTWYSEPQQPPPWMDAQQLSVGQQFFADHGLEMSAALFFASLPLSYAVPDAAMVLHRTSDFATHNLTRRVAETGQMLVDVMGLAGDGSFRPGGKAHATTSGLRILHGFVRQIVANHGWDTANFGVPANQEMLISTILDFTLVTWNALERMGLPVSTQERSAHLHAWSVVGHLLGIREDLLPLDLADVDTLHGLLQARHLPDVGDPATVEGAALAAALVSEMRSFMPLGWGRLPATLIRWLFHDAPGTVAHVPDALALPSPSRLMWTFLDIQRWLNLHLRPMPVLGAITRWISQRVGRWVIVALVEVFAPGRAPFEVPTELSERWRLSGSVPARRARAARRMVRKAVRSRQSASGSP